MLKLSLRCERERKLIAGPGKKQTNNWPSNNKRCYKKESRLERKTASKAEEREREREREGERRTACFVEDFIISLGFRSWADKNNTELDKRVSYLYKMCCLFL
jgi:hypothetical protein